MRFGVAEKNVNKINVKTEKKITKCLVKVETAHNGSRAWLQIHAWFCTRLQLSQPPHVSESVRTGFPSYQCYETFKKIFKLNKGNLNISLICQNYL